MLSTQTVLRVTLVAKHCSEFPDLLIFGVTPFFPSYVKALYLSTKFHQQQKLHMDSFIFDTFIAWSWAQEQL
jgi:hypothetical protein